MTEESTPAGYLFQSTPPAGGATVREMRLVIVKKFQSTPPRGGATGVGVTMFKRLLFQSTPPARGATGRTSLCVLQLPHISIHAPREGGDMLASLQYQPA